MKKQIDYSIAILKKAVNKRPYNIRLDTNNTCNLNCIYCKINDYTLNKEFMSVDQFCRLADIYFPKATYVSLSCATEPLITPNFNLFIRKLGEYNVPDTHFITNGQLLTDEIITSTVLSKISSITISNDAANSETYKTIGGSSFENLMTKLIRIDEIKKKIKFKITKSQDSIYVF